MPATHPSLGNPSTLEHHRPSVTLRDSDESAGKGGADDEDDVAPRPAPVPSFPLTRNWTSLQEHADTVRAVIGGSTPRAEDRREGFTWEVPNGGELNDKSGRRGYPAKPPSPPLIRTIHDSRNDAPMRSAPSRASADDFEPQSFKRRTSRALSSASSVGSPRLSRHDTGGSSIGSIARGVMRHVPDIMMFTPSERKSRMTGKHGTKDVHEDPPQHPNKAGRPLSSTLPPALKKRDIDKKVTKHVHVLDGPNAKFPEPTPLKGGLKDRRKLDQAEAMKLTLPLKMPNLPPRRRMSMSKMQDIAPPRPRSPKTPWIRETALSWQPQVDPSMIPETPSSAISNEQNGPGLLPDNDPIQSSVPPRFNQRPIRIRKYINRPRHSRTESATSEPSIASLGVFAPEEIQAPFQTPPINEPSSLKGVSKRPGRWRWSTPWNSSEAASGGSSTHEGLTRRYSFSRFFRAGKQSSQTSPPLSPFTQPDNNRISWHRTQPGSHSYGNALALANMPVPPTFVPPGLHRVPTPPTFDEVGEVKEKLANFVFEYDGVKRPKSSPGIPGRIWDSNVLLMSQDSNITPHSSPSEESPQGAITSATATPNTATKLTPSGSNPWSIPPPTPPTILPPKPFAAVTLSSALAPHSPTPSAEHLEWFRVPMDADSDINSRVKEIEERAKFEWLTPEHLPSSPLCPLNPKYRGPGRGMCVFHGQEGGSGGLLMDGESPVREGDAEVWGRGYLARRRRLMSSSSS
ncbi:hypothetical protein K505DRAFT_157985 [Melanomma pulvis-pyrius CBS 109.77]|uniref:Uncharacterized protein n=1 Tax=Melanomma pulvis-pyrius CBS 109.77 TaxID=1314802 RepID=A0A6A6XKB8_9PLEO|nr:hypothetical protein K505DRAFT_157985 [Melanomma pulvis-pyrius CBS 109.77]